MPITSLVVLTAFSLLGLALLVQGAILKSRGFSLLGRPTIDRFYFYSGKMALFTSWGMFLSKALLPSLGYIPAPAWLQWIAIGLLIPGCLIMIVSFFALGEALKVGLPAEKTSLHTGGIYRYSRNPIYLGVHLITVSSVLFFPDLANLGFAAYAFFIHHQIAIAEEKFLGWKFGEEYERYKASVGRYL